MSVKPVTRSALSIAAAAALAAGVMLAAGAPSNAVGTAAPAAPAVVAPAATAAATATTITTKWTWANGARIKAKQMKAVPLKRSDYYLRVQHNVGKGVTQAQTLPSGNGVGPDSTGRMSEFTKTGPKAYFKGKAPKDLYILDVVGTKVYAVGSYGHFYRFDGPTKSVVSLGKLPALTFDGVVSGSRVYFTSDVKVKGGKNRYVVSSRALSGGATRIEGMDARSPMATDAGVLVVRTKGAFAGMDVGGTSPVVGIGVLKGGKAKPFMNFTGKSGIEPQIGDGYWVFDASGHTLTLPNAGTAGQLVINLRNHKAWRVSLPKGAVPGWTGVDGARAAFVASDRSGAPVRNTLYITDADRGTLRTLSTPVSFTQPGVSGKAIGWVYDRKDGLTEYKSIVLK